MTPEKVMDIVLRNFDEAYLWANHSYMMLKAAEKANEQNIMIRDSKKMSSKQRDKSRKIFFYLIIFTNFMIFYLGLLSQMEVL